MSGCSVGQSVGERRGRWPGPLSASVGPCLLGLPSSCPTRPTAPGALNDGGGQVLSAGSVRARPSQQQALSRAQRAPSALPFPSESAFPLTVSVVWTHGLGLEGLDGLDVGRGVLCDGLELLERVLDLVNDGGVLEDGPVVGEVDLASLLGLSQERVLHSGVRGALAESRERGEGL